MFFFLLWKGRVANIEREFRENESDRSHYPDRILAVAAILKTEAVYFSEVTETNIQRNT